MQQRETFTIKAVLAFPYLAEMDENDKYSLQLANLSPAAVEKLESQGVEVKFKDDDKYGRGQFVSSTSKYPFKTIDSDGLPIDASTVGYGSVCRVKCTTYEWNYKQKSGVGTRVLSLVVDEVVSAQEDADTSGMEDAL